MKQFTYWTLTNELLRLLKRKSTKVLFKNLKSQSHEMVAFVEYEKGKRSDITLDPFLCGLLNAVVHELLHEYLDERIEYMIPEIQEEWIEAAELKLVKYIRSRKNLQERWRKCIYEKLAPEVKCEDN